MKTKNIMLGISLITVASQTLANGAFSEGTSGSAVSLPARPLMASNPFSEGTGISRLSQSDRETLMQWASNSAESLRKALQKARGEKFDQANRIYSKAIVDVVIRSYQTKGTEETLMRHVLNQALELTLGIPDENRNFSGGILAGTVNQELLTVILEESIQLAIEAYNGDERCIREKSLVRDQAEVMTLAIKRLELAQEWSSSIFEPALQLVFQRAALHHFIATGSDSRNLLKATFAEVLVAADDAVGNIAAGYEMDQENPLIDVAASAREFRGEINVILNEAKSRMDLFTGQKHNQQYRSNYRD